MRLTLSSIALLWLSAACERTYEVEDPGSVCIDDSDGRSGQLTADLVAGEPMLLALRAGYGCSTRIEEAYCDVEVDGRDLYVSTSVVYTVPGSLPFDNVEMCLTVAWAPCETPPLEAGETRVHYGSNVQVFDVPGRAEGCVAAQ